MNAYIRANPRGVVWLLQCSLLNIIHKVVRYKLVLLSLLCDDTQAMLSMMSGGGRFKYPPAAKLLRTDQALHNILVHTNPDLFEAGQLILIHNNDTWTYHMHFEVYNRGHFQDSYYPGYGSDATRGVVVSRWNLYPAILHQYDRDPLMTKMFDRTLDQWVEAAKVPGNAWLGTGVPQSGSTAPEDSAGPRNHGWQILGANEDYAWMDRDHKFHRVQQQSIVVRARVEH